MLGRLRSARTIPFASLTFLSTLNLAEFDTKKVESGPLLMPTNLIEGTDVSDLILVARTEAYGDNHTPGARNEFVEMRLLDRASHDCLVTPCSRPPSLLSLVATIGEWHGNIQVIP
jgi:hypothetical protein